MHGKAEIENDDASGFGHQYVRRLQVAMNLARGMDDLNRLCQLGEGSPKSAIVWLRPLLDL